jgi:hypothetical protein
LRRRADPRSLRRYFYLIHLYGKRCNRRCRYFERRYQYSDRRYQYSDRHYKHFDQHHRLERIAGRRRLKQSQRHEHVGWFERSQQHRCHDGFNRLEYLKQFGQFIREQYHGNCEFHFRSCGGAGG